MWLTRSDNTMSHYLSALSAMLDVAAAAAVAKKASIIIIVAAVTASQEACRDGGISHKVLLSSADVVTFVFLDFIV
jgi:hypothetical protein